MNPPEGGSDSKGDNKGVEVLQGLFDAPTRNDLIAHLLKHRDFLVEKDNRVLLLMVGALKPWKHIPMQRYIEMLNGCRELGIEEYFRRKDAELSPRLHRYNTLWSTFLTLKPEPELIPMGKELLSITDDILMISAPTTLQQAAFHHRTRGEIIIRLSEAGDTTMPSSDGVTAVERAYSLFKRAGDERACAECAAAIIGAGFRMLQTLARQEVSDDTLHRQIMGTSILAIEKICDKYRDDIAPSGEHAARLEGQIGIIRAMAAQLRAKPDAGGTDTTSNPVEKILGQIFGLARKAAIVRQTGQKPNFTEEELDEFARPLVEASRSLRPDLDLGMWLSTQNFAGLAYLRKGDNEGLSILRDALRTGRRLILTSTDNKKRERALAELAKLAENLADAAASAADLPLLYETAARSRTVRSSVYTALARIESDPAYVELVNLRRSIARFRVEVQDLNDEVEQIRNEIEQAGRIDIDPIVRWAPLIECQKRLNAKLSELTSASDKLAELLSLKGFVSSLEPPPLLDFAKAVPEGGAGVVIVHGREQGWLLVVPHGVEAIGPEHLVRLPGLTIDAVNDLVGIKEDDRGWLQAYNKFKGGLGRSLRIDGPETAAFSEEIDRVGEQLWTLVFGPLDAALRRLGFRGDGSEDVVLLPPGKLAILPLATAWRPEGDRRRPFLKDWVVVISQSPQAVVASAQRLSRPNAIAPKVLGVTDPLGDLTQKLPDFDNPGLAAFPEGSRVELRGGAANKAIVLEALSTATHVCFYTHGIWDPDDPARSGIVLYRAGRRSNQPKYDILSYTDLQRAGANLVNGRLWVLAACETGALDLKLPEEFAGIGAGLATEVPAILSTLFPVDASITEVTIRTFMHLHIRQGLTPARALRLVQLALMDGRDAVYALLRNDAASGPLPEHRAMHLSVPLFLDDDEEDDRPASLELPDPPVEDAWTRSYFWAGYQLAGL